MPLQSREDISLTADSASEGLDELVQRTRGLQPWRKAFHAFNGLVIVAGLVLLELSRVEALTILGAIGILLMVGDWVRLYSPTVNRIFFRSFSSLASPREAAGLASSTWYTFGAFTALLLAPRPEAISGILVLGLADPIASVVGQIYGKRPFLGGTVTGTATFLLVAGAILLLRHPWAAAMPAALLATVAERKSWPLDDNFAVPVITALVLVGAGRIF